MSFRILEPARPDAEFHGLCALAVMAKAPLAGRVKTRLSPPLTPEECARINACFLRDTVANLTDASRHAPAQWVISYTPSGAENAFDTILPNDALLLPQRGDTFGERLLLTAQDLFACGFSSVCLVDSDSPTVPMQEFVTAALFLLSPGDNQGKVVLGCSEDGGYYLIGMRAPHAELFARISWSTEQVARQTLQRVREAGLDCTLLQTWYDVDDQASLETLRAEFAGRGRQGFHAPYTRAYLAACAADLDARMAGAQR